MALNTLETAHTNGDVIDASHINELTLALLGAFVGRNGTGVPTPYQDLGTALVPWGNLYAKQLIINDTILDPSEITSKPNRIISGRTRTTSAKSDFLRASGAALSFTVLANDADLVLSINDTPVEVDEDILVTGVTAAPATNNTCQVNEPSIPAPFGANPTGGIYLGEDGDVINLDSMGSNVSSKVGQMVAFRNSYNDGSTTHTEILYGYLESTTKLRNIFRGFFFDSAGNPIKRSNFIGDNSILTIMNLGWVFIDVNATTVEVSYKTPVYSSVQPTSGAAGDYWFDQTIENWKRYSGSSWITVNRLLIGNIVADSTNCIASRSFDFDLKYSEENTIDLEIGPTGTFIARSKFGINRLNVNANDFEYNSAPIIWDLEEIIEEVPSPTNPNDLAVGDVYLYVREDGELTATLVKPYDRRNDLKGFYHPWESWRCVGRAYIAVDFGATELGIMSMATAFLFNPEIGNPVAELQYKVASNVSGGGSDLGANNAVFNSFDNPDGAVNAYQVSGGIHQIIFGRGRYEVNWDKVAFNAIKHKLVLIDSIHGEINEVGYAVDCPASTQTKASLRAVFWVRSIECIPSMLHLISQAQATSGMGLPFDALAPYDEIYTNLTIRKLQ